MLCPGDRGDSKADGNSVVSAECGRNRSGPGACDGRPGFFECAALWKALTQWRAPGIPDGEAGFGWSGTLVPGETLPGGRMGDVSLLAQSFWNFESFSVGSRRRVE